MGALRAAEQKPLDAPITPSEHKLLDRPMKARDDNPDEAADALI